jgi:hypothetical protein
MKILLVILNVFAMLLSLFTVAFAEGGQCDSVVLSPENIAKYRMKIVAQIEENYGNVTVRITAPKAQGECRFRSIELMRHDGDRITLATNIPYNQNGSEIQSDSISITENDLQSYWIYLFYGDNEKCSCVSSYGVEDLKLFHQTK